MAGFPFLLVLGSALAAAAIPQAQAQSRAAFAGFAASSAPRHASPAIHHGAFVRAPLSVAIRPAVSVRPLIGYYPVAPRPFPAPSRYYAAPGSLYYIAPYPADAAAYAYPATPQSWNFTPVDSIVALAGNHEIRQYCPDTRQYYPDTQTCPSPWLRVIP